MSGLVAGAALAAAVSLGGSVTATRLRFRPDASTRRGASQPPSVVVPAAAVVAWLAGAALVLVAVVAVALMVTPAVVSRRSAGRSRAARSAAVPEVALALSGELRSGRSIVDALRAAASGCLPLREVLESAAVAAAAGGDPGIPLLTAAERLGVDGLRRLAAVLSVAVSGAAVAGVLDRLATALDEELAAAAHVASLLAGPRATAVVLAVLPVAGLALGEAAGAAPLRLLLHTTFGAALLAAAAVLDGLGLAWTWRIAARALGSPRRAP